MDVLETARIDFFPVSTSVNASAPEASTNSAVPGDFAQALAQVPEPVDPAAVAPVTTALVTTATAVPEIAADAQSETTVDWTAAIPWTTTVLPPVVDLSNTVSETTTTIAPSGTVDASGAAQSNPSTPPPAPTGIIKVLAQNHRFQLSSRQHGIERSELPEIALAGLADSSFVLNPFLQQLSVTGPATSGCVTTEWETLTVTPSADEPQSQPLVTMPTAPHADAVPPLPPLPSFIVYTLPPPAPLDSSPPVTPVLISAPIPAATTVPVAVAPTLETVPKPRITVQTSPRSSTITPIDHFEQAVAPTTSLLISPAEHTTALPQQFAAPERAAPVNPLPAFREQPAGTNPNPTMLATPPAMPTPQSLAPTTHNTIEQHEVVTPAVSPATDHASTTAAKKLTNEAPTIPVIAPAPRRVLLPTPKARPKAADDPVPQVESLAAVPLPPFPNNTVIDAATEVTAPTPTLPASAAVTAGSSPVNANVTADAPMMETMPSPEMPVKPVRTAPVDATTTSALPTSDKTSRPDSETDSKGIHRAPVASRPARNHSTVDTPVTRTDGVASVSDNHSAPNDGPSPSVEASFTVRTEHTLVSAPALDFGDPVPIQSSAQLVQRLGDAIGFARESGQHLSIRVMPPQFGPIVVEVRIHGGEMSARVETHSAVAQQMITDHLPQLHESLAARGATLDRIDIIPVENRVVERSSVSDRGPGERESTGGAWVSTGTSERQGAEPQDSNRRRPPQPQPAALVEALPPAVAPSASGRPVELQALNVRV